LCPRVLHFRDFTYLCVRVVSVSVSVLHSIKLANSSKFKSLLLCHESTREQTHFSANSSQTQTKSVESVKPANLKSSEWIQIYFVLYLCLFVLHLWFLFSFLLSLTISHHRVTVALPSFRVGLPHLAPLWCSTFVFI